MDRMNTARLTFQIMKRLGFRLIREPRFGAPPYLILDRFTMAQYDELKNLKLLIDTGLCASGPWGQQMTFLWTRAGAMVYLDAPVLQKAASDLF